MQMCSMSICLSVSASLALSGGVKLWCNSSKGSTPVELKHPPPFRIIIYTSNLQGLEPLAHSTVSKHFLNSQECHKSMKCVLVCVCVCVCSLFCFASCHTHVCLLWQNNQLVDSDDSVASEEERSQVRNPCLELKKCDCHSQRKPIST